MFNVTMQTWLVSCKKKRLFICKLNKNDGTDFNVILKFHSSKFKGRL